MLIKLTSYQIQQRQIQYVGQICKCTRQLLNYIGYIQFSFKLLNYLCSPLYSVYFNVQLWFFQIIFLSEFHEIKWAPLRPNPEEVELYTIVQMARTELWERILDVF